MVEGLGCGEGRISIGERLNTGLELQELSLKEMQQQSPVHMVIPSESLQKLLNKLKTVFKNEIVCVKKFKVHHCLKGPVFCRARLVFRFT